MIATSGFLTALECNKFDFSRGSAQDPAGELTVLPRPPSWFKGLTSLRGEEGKGQERRGRERGEELGDGEWGEWKGRGRDERERGREGRKKERRGRKGEERKVRTPPLSIPAYAPAA